MARKTAMNKEPSVSVALPESEKRRLGMPTSPSDKPLPKRLSPGVYRSASGQLQTAAGRPLERPTTSPMPANRLVDAMSQQQSGQIATRPPAPLGTPPGGMQSNGQQPQGSPPLGDFAIPPPSQTQQQRPQSVTGLLQQAGQPQQPMMQNDQMQFPMPQLTFEQWKQMQMAQRMQNQMMPPFKGS